MRSGRCFNLYGRSLEQLPASFGVDLPANVVRVRPSSTGDATGARGALNTPRVHARPTAPWGNHEGNCDAEDIVTLLWLSTMPEGQAKASGPERIAAPRPLRTVRAAFPTNRILRQLA